MDVIEELASWYMDEDALSVAIADFQRRQSDENALRIREIDRRIGPLPYFEGMGEYQAIIDRLE